jgi:hypothetical protein
MVKNSKSANCESRVANRARGAGILLFSLFAVFYSLLPLLAQQPQAPAGTPLYSVNAKYVNGMAPGYWPTAGTGLVLNLSAGTAYCGNPPVPVSYPGGSLALTASATNYIYLDPANNCSPAASTAAFAAGQVPVATVVTGASSITSITDARTWFTPQPCVTGSAGDLHCSSLGTNQNIVLSPSGSGATVITNLADKGGQVFNVMAYGAKGDGTTDDTAAIQAAYAAVGSGGGTVLWPAGDYKLTGTVTITKPTITELPCGTITAGAQLFNGSTNDIKFYGCGSGKPGTGADITPSGTTLIKIGGSYPSATDMIYVGSPTRTSYPAAEISGTTIKDISFDMGSNTGNAFHLVSDSYVTIDGVKAWNCVNCGEIDGGLSGDTYTYSGYHTTIKNSQFQPVAASTGYGLWFNAQYGEVTYIDIDSSRVSGNITDGGGLSEILFQAGSAAADSVNSVSIKTSYIGNPVCSAGSYGIRFEAPGNFLAATGGRITNVNLQNSLIERIFSCSSGYPLGGTSGGSAGTGGLGAFHLDNILSGASWATNLINVDLGSGMVATTGDLAGPMSSQPIQRIGGSQQGNNSMGLKINNAPVATANGDDLFGLYVSPTFTDGSYTGVKHTIANFTSASGGGAVNLGSSVYLSLKGQNIDGSCSMSSGTSCTSAVTAGSHCVATVQGTSPIASACQISGGTLTVTAASSNSDTWAWHITD